MVLWLILSAAGLQAQRGILRDLRDRTINKPVDMVIDYYLSKANPNHVGVDFGSGTEMFMVIAGELQATVTYMTVGDKLHATAMENMAREDEEEENLERLENFSITEVPSKEFLGYQCLGRKMEDEAYEFLIYIAPNMEAHMGSLFAPGNQEMPPALEAYGQNFADGLMMFMQITDKAGQGRNSLDGTMECLAFEPKERSFFNGDYLFTNFRPSGAGR